MEGDTSGLLSVPDGDMATPDRADPGAQQQAAMPATTSPKAPAPLLPADLSPDAGFATPAPVPMAPAPVHNVHVRCEACKSLLEVGVPMTQVMMGDPIVVRCGSCTTLLRVALRPTAPAPPPPHMESAFMTQLRMQAAAAAQHQHKLRMMAMYGQMGMMPPTPHSMGQHPPRPEAMYLPSPMNSFGRGFGGMMQPPMMASLSPGVAPGVGHHPGAWMFPPRGVGGGAVGGGGSPDVQRMKVTREPSAYNLHMRDELRRLKSDQPGIEHREAWKMASGSWKKVGSQLEAAATETAQQPTFDMMSAGPWVGQPAPVAGMQAFREGELLASMGAKRKRLDEDSTGGDSPERGPQPPAALTALPLTPVAVHGPPLADGPDAGGWGPHRMAGPSDGRAIGWPGHPQGRPCG